jgi:hypothetical protein
MVLTTALPLNLGKGSVANEQARRDNNQVLNARVWVCPSSRQEVIYQSFFVSV